MDRKYIIVEKSKKIKGNKIINNKSNRSINFKRFIIFILIIFFILTAVYISNNKFREFVDLNILKKIVNEENLKEIYDNVNDQNVFVSNKNIHILNSGEMKNYDRNGNLISSNILGIGAATSNCANEYLVITEKNGRKIFLFEKGKLKWERELDINIHNIYVNQNGQIVAIGDSSMYTSIIILIDNNGNQYLKKYFSSKYANKAGITLNNKYLVISLIDYSKIQISSEIEILDIEKTKKDEKDAVLKKYTKDEIIIDMAIEEDDLLIKTIDSVYYINTKEMKKVHDISVETAFITLGVSGGFAEIVETKSNLFSQKYELKLYDKLGSSIGVLMLDENMPKHLHSNGMNILVEMPQSIIIASDMGWMKKKYNSSRSFIGVKISDGIAAIVYSDKVVIISI